MSPRHLAVGRCCTCTVMYRLVAMAHRNPCTRRPPPAVPLDLLRRGCSGSLRWPRDRKEIRIGSVDSIAAPNPPDTILQRALSTRRNRSTRDETPYFSCRLDDRIRGVTTDKATHTGMALHGLRGAHTLRPSSKLAIGRRRHGRRCRVPCAGTRPSPGAGGGRR